MQSQPCQETQHSQCGGWAWWMPGQAVGPDCDCPCHAALATAQRADSLSWLASGSPRPPSSLLERRGTIHS